MDSLVRGVPVDKIDVMAEVEELGRYLMQVSTERPVLEPEVRPPMAMASAIAHCIGQWYVIHDRLNQLEAEVAELRRAA
jgi:hypothetical protein